MKSFAACIFALAVAAGCSYQPATVADEGRTPTLGKFSALPEGGDAAFTASAFEIVDAVAREDGFIGAILVARGDKVLLRKAAGFANQEQNVPNTPETRFPLESDTKQFTAAAIMLLVQAGKVALDDPISKYYPTSPPAWEAVTIKHLLTHSSGIEDYWARRPEVRSSLAAGQLFTSGDDLIRLVAGDLLAFQPGSGFEYSNVGYALLADVIEHASGQRYGDFLRTRIFVPLGMRNTGYGDVGLGPVKGYLRVVMPATPSGDWKPGSPFKLGAQSGFGGIYSTLDDMLIWSRALEKSKILSSESKAAIFADYGHHYGFGWYLQTKFGTPLIWHTGADNFAGFGSIFDRFPEDELTVVGLTNGLGATPFKATLMVDGQAATFQANAAREVVEKIERLYFGRAP